MGQQSTFDHGRGNRVRRWLRGALLRTRREQSGSVLVLITVSMVGLFGMAAMTIDVGILMQERRSLQNAADAAALAAARYLPADPDAAEAAARDFLVFNGYDPADATFTRDYNGDPSAFAVTIEHEVSLAFAPVIGSVTGTPYATAVGKVVTAEGDNYAIFSLSVACPGSDEVSITGSGITINGTVHSNGDAKLDGSNNTIDPAITYACEYSQGGSGHTITNGVKLTGTRESPVSYAYADLAPPCQYGPWGVGNVLLKTKPVWIDPAKTILKPGIYCFDGSVTISGFGIKGVGNDQGFGAGVTFVARGDITVSASNVELKPFKNLTILFYSEGDIRLTGAGGDYTGLMYAPNGSISIESQGADITGALIAQTVSISTTDVTLTADGSVETLNLNPVVTLIE